MTRTKKVEAALKHWAKFQEAINDLLNTEQENIDDAEADEDVSENESNVEDLESLLSDMEDLDSRIEETFPS